MENNSDNIFDERLRRMLADAEEMPPERVWDGIVASMEAGTAGAAGAAKRSRVRALWLSGLGLVSVAAAVAAFVLLRLPGTENIDIQNVVAEETAGNVSIESFEDGDIVDIIREDVQKVEIAEAMDIEAFDLAETVAEEVTEDLADAPEEATVTETVKPENTDLIAEAAAWDIPDVFAQEQKADERHIYELTVGGNSFIGPGRKTESIKMMSQGRFKIPTSTAFVENEGTDYYYLPMSFGVGVKFGILKWLEIGIGVNYTLLMKRVTGNYYEYDSSGSLVRSGTAELKNSQHYIGIPLDIFFNIYGNEHWNTYASVGGCIEKCVSNHYNGIFDNQEINHKVLVQGIQSSVKLGLGVEYCPVRYLGIYIDPSLRYYFDNNQPRSIRTSQPLSFGVEAGLRFKL